VTRLVLIRHAAHDLAGVALAGRMPGVGLNAQGRAQAQALGDAMANTPASGPLAAVYSSPQRRARETASVVAHRLGLTVQVAVEFDEIDFGEWTGRHLQELSADSPGWREWVERRATAAPPGGEAFAKVRQRMLEGVERLRRAHPSGTVAVVSHADPIKALLATHLAISLNDLERFDVDCASLSIIDFADGWAKVRCVNCPRPPAAR
jgi:broad specificity phosphatase PhoE